MTSDRGKKRAADAEYDYFKLCVESLFSPLGDDRYCLPAEQSAEVCKHESAVRRKLGLPDATSDELVRAWRLRKAQNYCSRRRDRSPRANEPAGRVVFAHDSEGAEALRELVAAVNQLSAESARDGRGGRARMIAALQITTRLLERIPGADLTPIAATLGKLEEALRDLDHGIVHAALKPLRQGPRGPSDRRRDEFRRRCVEAVLSAGRAGASDPIKQVFDAARETAVLVGPFKVATSRPQTYDRRNPGQRVFTTNTVRNWVEEHKTKLNKAKGELRPLADGDFMAMSLGLAGIGHLLWLRSLSPENIERSVNEIAQEVMRERGVRMVPVTGLITQRIDSRT